MESKQKRDCWWVCLLLTVATLALYFPVIHFDFVTFDDPEYVFENPGIKQGISTKSLTWAFTTTHAGNWHPLTWISHTLDWTLFGANAGGHHFTNVILHLASTLILFFTLRRMTGAIWRSGFVAALFALHPLHIESVAWVSERKDVLSALFWMLTMLFYARYVTIRADAENHLTRAAVFNYTFAVIAFALGLLAKQMLVTLPFVLLLLDIWPLKRRSAVNFREFLKLFLEKIPFFAITGIFIPVAIWAQKVGNAVVSSDVIPLDRRIENIMVSYFRYFAKMVWPTKLSVFYPYPDIWPISMFVSAAMFLIVGWAIAIWQLKRRPFIFVGWSWFLGVLVPVIGLLQIGSQSMADRYSYIPLIGLFIAISWGVCELEAKGRAWRRVVVIGMCGLVAGCTLMSARQLPNWKNSVALYESGLASSEKNITLHMNLGSTFLEEGKTNAALEQYTAVLKINPVDPLTHGNLARIYAAQGDWDRAVQHYETALLADPRNARLHNTYGFSLAKRDKLDEAVQHFQAALDSKPDLVQAAFNLGDALRRQGKTEEAIAAFERGLQIDPNDSAAHLNLGTLLLSKDRNSEAEAHFREALRLQPDFAQAHHNLAMALLAEEKTNSSIPLQVEAKLHFREAIRLNTNNAIAHAQLAFLANKENDVSESVREYRAALNINPEWPDVLNNLAWILATDPDPKVRNGDEAVRLAERACQLVGFKTPMFIGTLAAAYAEAGNFEKAIEMGDAAYQTANSAGQTEVAEKNLELLKLYRAGQPYWAPNTGTKK